jgi:AraC-like DNA-binding protein
MSSRRQPKKSAFPLESDVSSVLMRRQTNFLPDGAYLFEDRVEIKGVVTTKVITCAAWLLELYDLQSGEVSFVRGDARIRPQTKRFGVFYPPFTISQPYFNDAMGRLVGVAATMSLPTELTAIPVVFETNFTGQPSCAEQVIETVRSGQNRQSIEMNPHPSLLSIKAKKLIDASYLVYPAISRVAARLKVTHEHLSRQFKRDYALSPSDYLRQLRVADAPLRLARGEEIINVSQDVGYNDLSRFYKQFRQTMNTSPGVCKTLMRPKRA